MGEKGLGRLGSPLSHTLERGLGGEGQLCGVSFSV